MFEHVWEAAIWLLACAEGVTGSKLQLKGASEAAIWLWVVGYSESVIISQ